MDQTTHPTPDSVPEQQISVQDVLRAIFLPERVSEAVLPDTAEQENVTASSMMQAEQENLVARLAELNAPTSILYDTPVKPIQDTIRENRIALLAAGSLLALLLAYLAQRAMGNPAGRFGGLLYAVAALVWAGTLLLIGSGLVRRGPQREGAGPARPQPLTSDTTLVLRLGLSSAALMLSVATYIGTADNVFTAGGVVSWIASVIVWMLALSRRTPDELIRSAVDAIRTWKRPALPTRQALVPIAATVLILIAAAFFRFYKLDAVPNEMTSDHVEKLKDAYAVHSGFFHVFFTGNGGREAIQFYLVSWVADLFGTGFSFRTLKLVSALEGLALIPLMIWLGREVIDSETGFLAAALIAVSWWHTALSRLALRIVLTPLLITPFLITLIRGIRTGSRRSWLWAGFWLGVGVYGYQSLRIAPLIAIAAYLISIGGPLLRAVRSSAKRHPDAQFDRVVAVNTIQRQTANLVVAAAVALALFVPMLRVWKDYPDQLWNRVINRTTENEVNIQGSASEVFVDNYADALRMFNVAGDTSWFTSVPGAPMLGTIAGALFLLALITWIIRLRVRNDAVDYLMIAAILVMLLPSALAIAFPIENPSATRASGVIPVVYLMAAWPLALITQAWRHHFGSVIGTATSGILIAVLIGVAAVGNYNSYFNLYADSYRRAALNPGEVADAVRAEIGEDAPLDGVWLQGWPHWHDYRAIGIEAGDITFSNAILDDITLEQNLQVAPEMFGARPLVFIVHPMDTEALELLETHYPEGKATLHPSPTEGRDFILYVVRE